MLILLSLMDVSFPSLREKEVFPGSPAAHSQETPPDHIHLHPHSFLALDPLWDSIILIEDKGCMENPLRQSRVVLWQTVCLDI